MSYGEPISSVADGLGTAKIRHAYLFIIDGCKADAFEHALFDRNLFPLFRAYVDRGYQYFRRCYTAFPSVTIPCHSTIVTGAFPGTHGIVGNNWFRQRYTKPALGLSQVEYVRVGTLNNPGLFIHFGRANDHLGGVRTLFEAYTRRTGREDCYSIFEMIYRGTAPTHHKHLLWGLIGRFLRGSLIWELFLYLSRRTDHLSFAMDEAALDTATSLVETKAPSLVVTWLPGMDGFSHRRGADQQGEYMETLAQLDRQWAGFMRALEKKRYLDDTVVVITADHGQYQCAEEGIPSHRITLQDLYRNVYDHPLDQRYMKLLPLSRDVGGTLEINPDAKDYSIVFAPNGGMCHVYVAELQDDGRLFWGHKERWRNHDYVETLQRLCAMFADFRGIGLIVARRGTTEFQLWDRQSAAWKPLSTLDDQDFPLSSRRLPPLAHSIRTGDILLIAKPPFYFSDKLMNGEHGSLGRVDSHVPLLILCPGLGSVAGYSDTPVCVADIAPTLARVMGFLEELRAPAEQLPPRPPRHDEAAAIRKELQNEVETLITAKQDFVRRVEGIEDRAERERLSTIGEQVFRWMWLSAVEGSSDSAQEISEIEERVATEEIDHKRYESVFGHPVSVVKAPAAKPETVSMWDRVLSALRRLRVFDIRPGVSQPIPEAIPRRAIRAALDSWTRRVGTRVMITGTVALVAAILIASTVLLGPPGALLKSLFEAGPPQLDPSRIAVLAFEDRSEGQTLHHATEVVRETLTGELAAVKTVHLISRDQVSSYSGPEVATMARALRVGTVVVGVADQLPSGPQVTVQVLDGASGTHVATWRVDLRDSASLHRDVVVVAAELVRLRLQQRTLPP